MEAPKRALDNGDPRDEQPAKKIAAAAPPADVDVTDEDAAVADAPPTAELNEWRTEGPYVGDWITRKVLGHGPRVASFCVGRVVGYLSAAESDYVGKDGMASPLWHVAYASGELAGDEEDLEERELLDSAPSPSQPSQPSSDAMDEDAAVAEAPPGYGRLGQYVGDSGEMIRDLPIINVTLGGVNVSPVFHQVFHKAARRANLAVATKEDLCLLQCPELRGLCVAVDVDFRRLDDASKEALAEILAEKGVPRAFWFEDKHTKNTHRQLRAERRTVTRRLGAAGFDVKAAAPRNKSAVASAAAFAKKSEKFGMARVQKTPLPRTGALILADNRSADCSRLWAVAADLHIQSSTGRHWATYKERRAFMQDWHKKRVRCFVCAKEDVTPVFDHWQETFLKDGVPWVRYFHRVVDICNHCNSGVQSWVDDLKPPAGDLRAALAFVDAKAIEAASAIFGPP